MDYVQRHNEILHHYNTLENQYSRAIENSLLAKKKLNTYQNTSLDMYPTVLDIHTENIQTFHKTP